MIGMNQSPLASLMIILDFAVAINAKERDKLFKALKLKQFQGF